MRSLLAALLLLSPALAQASGQRAAPAPRPAPMSEAGALCHPAIEAAERAEQIPAGLLRSIAHVESARPDPVSGRYVPWPWTINAEGEGRYFETKEEAVAATRALIASGVRSIDVGCAQVNLMHHPQAFASLEQAFDPMSNVTYAARFLKSLRIATGSWPFAAAGYHSLMPERGHAYAQRVAAVWPDAAQHGPWPLAPSDLVLAAPGAVAPVAPRTDYSIYTPAFAAQLRRMDADRAPAARQRGNSAARPGRWQSPAARAGDHAASAATRGAVHAQRRKSACLPRPHRCAGRPARHLKLLSAPGSPRTRPHRMPRRISRAPASPPRAPPSPSG